MLLSVVGLVLAILSLVAVVALHAIHRGAVRTLKRRVGRLDKRNHDLFRMLREERRARLAHRYDLAPAAQMPVRFTSDDAGDLFLAELFEGRRDGACLEIGAFDGVTGSQTYALHAIGWRCLLVEPLPEHAEACERNRPGAVVVHAACSRSGSTGTVSFAAVRGKQRVSHIEGDASRARASGAHRGAVERIDAPLTTLARVIPPEFPRLDVAVIDVEGHEAEVLDGLDLATNRPRVLFVEHPESGARSLRTLLEPHRYALAGTVGPNAVFVDADERALAARAAILASGAG